MLRLTKLTALALAAWAVLVVTPALAANAVMLDDSPVRQSPSNGSPVINSVDEGDEVTVVDCQGQYCKLQIPGPDGWVRSNRLGALDDEGPAPQSPFNFSFGVGPDGPSISFGVGNAPSGPSSDPRVCFFRNNNYAGASFCAEPGDGDDALSGNWDNAISSIRVYGGAEAIVCRDEDLSGTCAVISTSRATLPSQLNNRISSYEVEY